MNYIRKTTFWRYLVRMDNFIFAMSAFPLKADISQCLIRSDFKSLYFDYIDKVFMLRDHQME